MHLEERINAFVSLGEFLGQFASETPTKNDHVSYNDTFYEPFLNVLSQAKHHNSWFIDDNLAFSCKSWAEALSEENIQQWVSNYEIPKTQTPKTIAVIMAGNVPLVGFHDFISVLLSGHIVKAKLSSNDNLLLPFLAKYLITIAPAFEERISFTKDQLKDFDAVIATGSNNTARYFEYYFGKYPHIIRKNRNSVAVITGKETPEQMEALADDVFRYFGLGCRNVSKVYLPKDYDLDHFFNGMFSWKHVINNHKYINNYDYNKAVYLMSDIKLLDNEFLLLKNDEGFSSPISVVFYERYESIEMLSATLSEEKENIQCIVSEAGIDGQIPFGTAQSPALWDYADGVDTLAFLLSL